MPRPDLGPWAGAGAAWRAELGHGRAGPGQARPGNLRRLGVVDLLDLLDPFARRDLIDLGGGGGGSPPSEGGSAHARADQCIGNSF